MKIPFGTPPTSQVAPENLPWYDRKERIVESLKSLEDFGELVAERYRAGNERNEELSEFYVFGGRFRLDRCGNTMRARVDPLPERFRVLAPVLAHDEFFAFHEQCRRSDPRIDPSVSHSFGPTIPSVRMCCAYCAQHWTIENAHDIYELHTTTVVPLDAFVGLTLADVHRAYEGFVGAAYRAQPELLLRNDRWIDHSPKYPNPTKDWEHSIVVNQNGWRGVSDGLGGETIIQLGDEAFFDMYTFFHTECWALHLANKTYDEFCAMFVAAGFPDPVLQATPNLYGSESYRGPWYTTPTEIGGMLRIGWRKRVIEIDWSGVDSAMHHRLALLFAKEETTHSEHIVHANDGAHAVSCLSRIHESIKGRMSE